MLLAGFALLGEAGVAAQPSSIIGWSSESHTFGSDASFRDGLSVQGSTFFESMQMPKRGVSVVFVQDGVDLDDFARFGGIYGEKESAIPNIKSAIASAESSTFAPTVSGVQGDVVVHALGESVVQVTAEDFADARITPSALNSTTVIVTLPPVDAADKAAALARNDALVGKIVATLSRDGVPVCAMVVSTGSAPHGAATHLRYRSRRSSSSESASAATGRECKTIACRNARNVGKPVFTMYFSTTVMMGVVVCGLMVMVFLVGTFGLMVLSINDGKFPDPTDDDLIISTRNE
jgi:hypothetical protein